MDIWRRYDDAINDAEWVHLDMEEKTMKKKMAALRQMRASNDEAGKRKSILYDEDKVFIFCEESFGKC